MQYLLSALFLTLLSSTAQGRDAFEKDVITTSAGDLEITFIGHGSLMLQFGGATIHVDPYGRLADYGTLPRADVVLVTHDHQDHLDPAAIRQVRTADTTIILTELCEQKLGEGIVMKNGDIRTAAGVRIEAVPAYNVVHKRENGQPFHPLGQGNGYILTFGDKRVYIAGDTENTPEMMSLGNIDVAFLPMNLPYTMTPGMVADAARAIRPAVLYPYHYGETEPGRLAALLRDEKGIEVRVRKMR